MSEPAIPTMPEGPGVRALKLAVIVMGIMLVLGVLGVIGRMVYLASQGPRQASSVASGARLTQSAKLALPTGAHVRQISLSGDRLAVHYEGPASSGIAIVDLGLGLVISRVEVVPEVPR